MRRGAAVALCGAGLTLVALTFDAAPLFVPAIALAALGVLTPAWIWVAARGTSAHRRLDTDRVTEGDPVRATLEITRGLIRPPVIEVSDPLGGQSDWPGRALWPGGSGRRATINVVARLHRRGRHEFPQPALIVRDPLELARARRGGGRPPDEVLVLPRTERVDWRGRDLGGAVHHGAGAAAAEPLAAVEVDGLRPYRVGAPASRIHWPALARGAGLLERRLRADADTRPLVVLDSRCPDPEAPELDAAVRAAASLALALGRAGGCSLLLPGERRSVEIDPELRAWPGAHVRLALVEGGPAVRPPGLGYGGRAGRIFYVAAQPPQRVPPALLSGGRLAAALVLPAGLAAATRAELAFEVAGCRGYLLGVGGRARTRRQVA